MNRIDWPGLMRAGMQGFRLTPDAFWRLTPAELQLLLGQGVSETPMSRAKLDELLSAYPDVERRNSKQGESDD